MATRAAYEAVTQEILSERASSLARATDRLEAALADLARARAALERAPTPARRAAREEALAEAAERLWFVVIQREALGLRRHEVLHEVLRVPAEVRGRMGPRRRG
jgi:hypothetical protein